MVECRGQVNGSILQHNNSPILMMSIGVPNKSVEHQISNENIDRVHNAGERQPSQWQIWFPGLQGPYYATDSMGRNPELGDLIQCIAWIGFTQHLVA